jgi:hypothetical protein
VVVTFEQIEPFPGLLVATRKAGTAVAVLPRPLRQGSVALQSGVPAIDELYEFRADNADAARTLVAGRLA